MSRAAAAAVPDAVDAPAGFTVRLDNFEGPFDLLLQLISKHKLDVTEVSLSTVTDEFIAYIAVGATAWDLEQTSSFLLVAATLLDLKTARLLPSGEVDDLEDLALLEARDLLFARLLQYRAFKTVSGHVAARLGEESARFARPGGLEAQFAALVPDVTLPPAGRLATILARLLAPQQAAEVSLTHLHGGTVNVKEQARLVVARLQAAGTLTFRRLTADADRATTVARFLALLELFRDGAVTFEQLSPLGELTLRWTGSHDQYEISDEYDQPASQENP
ncbi:segregation/condensation protein A [Tessaracoccus sp. SD287]|uniref:segregation and condensation protein A n=1 Tax=Tessaracoccus sp. SD287 TaxID=2782008 RepID=UPI001A978059|nr:ScpA family protein [Tessaracoccus sp. SD287]MBO1029915.1 segregation/condensation protein A [Tessaracoccus sp. SD287]